MKVCQGKGAKRVRKDALSLWQRVEYILSEQALYTAHNKCIYIRGSTYKYMYANIYEMVAKRT